MTARVTNSQIECARARGWSLAETCSRLGVHPGRVADIWARMDEAVAEDPTVPMPRRRQSPINNHGTRAGYVRHLNRRELPCPACVQANRDDWARRAAKRRAVA